MKQILFTLFILFPSLIFGQVVNTEKLRVNSKDEGWQGEVDFSFGLTRNKAGQSVNLGALARMEYLKNKTRWVLLGGGNLTQFKNIDVPGSAPKNFTNNRFLHLRYNYDITPGITLEAFSQIQHDEIQEMNLRQLTGIGPRFRFWENDTSQLFFGALYMYEYEETTDLPELTINRDHRLSAYISGAYSINEYFTVNHVTYFQPNLNAIEDSRISSETSFQVKLNDKLSFNTYFLIIYDRRPPETVPRSMYFLRNGLSLSL